MWQLQQRRSRRHRGRHRPVPVLLLVPLIICRLGATDPSRTFADPSRLLPGFIPCQKAGDFSINLQSATPCAGMRRNQSGGESRLWCFFFFYVICLSHWRDPSSRSSPVLQQASAQLRRPKLGRQCAGVEGERAAAGKRQNTSPWCLIVICTKINTSECLYRLMLCYISLKSALVLMSSPGDLSRGSFSCLDSGGITREAIKHGNYPTILPLCRRARATKINPLIDFVNTRLIRCAN